MAYVTGEVGHVMPWHMIVWRFETAHGSREVGRSVPWRMVVWRFEVVCRGMWKYGGLR